MLDSQKGKKHETNLFLIIYSFITDIYSLSIKIINIIFGTAISNRSYPSNFWSWFSE
jgi:hypothetical protein